MIVFTWIGIVVACGVAAIAAAALVILAVRYWPFRFQWSRNTPSFLKAPYGTMSIDALIGVSQRGSGTWFFGLMLLGERKAGPSSPQGPADHG